MNGKTVTIVAGVVTTAAVAFILGYIIGKYVKIPPKKKRYKIITDDQGNIKEIIVVG